MIAEKLGTEALAASQAPSRAVLRAHFVVLGNPIYGYSVLPDMDSFLVRTREILIGKPLVAFVVCGDMLWNPRTGEGGTETSRS